MQSDSASNSLELAETGLFGSLSKPEPLTWLLIAGVLLALSCAGQHYMMAVGLAGLYVALMTTLSGAFVAAALPSALYICCALFSLGKVTSPMVTIDVGYPYLQGRIAVPAAAWGFAKSNTLLIKLLDGLVCAHATKLSVDSMHGHVNITRMAAHVSLQSTLLSPASHLHSICIPSAHCRMMCYMCPTASGRKAQSASFVHPVYTHSCWPSYCIPYHMYIHTVHVIPYMPCISCIPCIPCIPYLI